ncbi:hypothetical protein PAALTS15_11204 [Paenibacillus alvei TS-15]|jgi:Family of unknown function (DUF6054)|uniref:Uncharacterized protein n=1 Tax=Paenibacillus alvei TS-15 TaxID=1117108 RepID=S9SRN6_PAEAL|nr:DUF6054 family protein [Paenibacillus alvei]EPY07359.1 hypothetical protein PAALTS15_11204 [Paenibacillus alvei TS-15]
MSKRSFNVSITPYQALEHVMNHQTADLVHEEYHPLGEGKEIGTQVYEKYYFRSKNRAALIVMIDNLRGVTNVRVVATGSSEGVIFNFDWGAADDFVSSVERILEDYIID